MSARWWIAALLLCGCQDPFPITEVALVVDSDLKVPDDVDGIQLGLDGVLFTQPLVELPSSVGVVSRGSTPAFSASVQLLRFDDGGTIVVSRSVTDVRFVEGRTMMLVLRLPAACACDGTNCPNPGADPDCDALVNPALVPFDPDVAPPSGHLSPYGAPTPERSGP